MIIKNLSTKDKKELNRLLKLRNEEVIAELFLKIIRLQREVDDIKNSWGYPV